VRVPRVRPPIRPDAVEDLDRELEVLARLMDTMFRVPGLGWRFGLDPILGLVPMVGDFIATAVSVYILLAALRYGVPKITLVRMGLNVGIDMVVGSVPFVGDLFDAYWKANVRNLQLLRQRAHIAGRRGADFSDWLFVGVIVAVLLALLLGGIVLIGWAVGQLIGALRGQVA
jgi:Domain of unknown function (DUF4112)